MRSLSICHSRKRRIRRWQWAAAVLACLWPVHTAFALHPSVEISQFVHDRWTAENGLLGGSIYAICQSSDGYLWIGTERGLVRFDGSHFTLIQQPIAGMGSLGPVLGLVSDAAGDMWIRLEDLRLLLYRGGHFEDANARFHLFQIPYTAMANDYEHGILLANGNEQTLQYRGGKFVTIVATGQIPNAVISLAQTRDQTIWLGTRDSGLFRMAGGGPESVSSELSDAKINVLLPAISGGLWIGTDHGLRYWDGHGLVELPLPASVQQVQILALLQDRDGNIWAGTDHGLIRISPGGTVSLALLHSGPGYEVTTIFEDRDGAIWFGGSAGLERLRDGMFTTYTTAQGMPTDTVGPVWADSDGRTWFGPVSGGLYWIENGLVHRVTAAGLDDDVVYSISGGDGEIWVGRQHGGLTVLTQDGDSFSARTYTQVNGLAPSSVYSVCRERDGTVWAGTISGGVSRLKDGAITNFTDSNGVSLNSINSMLEGYDGRMWFATPFGLVSYSRGRWTNYPIVNGTPAPSVGTIFQDSRHVLWLATSDGLAVLSSGKVRVLKRLPGPLREQIFGITEDKLGFLWIVTSDHVLQVNRDDLLKGTLIASDIRSYGTKDGLRGVEGVSRDRSVMTDGNGRIWMSLNRGLSVADPRLTINSSMPVEVRINEVLAGGAPIDFQAIPRVPSGNGSVTFDYAGTSLSNLDRIRYRYKLEGFDRDWSGITASPQVTYTNLDPGSYRFRIIASNGLGLWNGPETDVPFVIERAFWQTWWFRMLCGLAGVLLILALYQLRLYRHTKQLNMRFQERLAERTRIAQELHDTLLQGVLSASLQLDVADEQLPEDSPAKPMLQRVLRIMGRISEEGRNTLRGLRTPEADNSSLEIAFSRMRQELAIDEKVGYRVMANGGSRTVRPLIRDEVYRVGREALVNAFLHAQASSIEVEVEYASKHLRVLVRDDGRGIDPQVLDSGRAGHWGLPGMRERSESIGASLKLRSRIGMGTEIELTVPGKVAFEDEAQSTLPRWLPWMNREEHDGDVTTEKDRAHK